MRGGARRSLYIGAGGGGGAALQTGAGTMARPLFCLCGLLAAGKRPGLRPPASVPPVPLPA